MKEVKRQLEWFAFYDKTAIEEKLEAMAAKGWLIEQPGTYLWRYRRIEPKKLHVTVTYFPNASAFDPEPTEGQQRMADFCARDGWIPAARWGQMQIFYNEQEDPVPIETDPVTQVETIHRSVKKNMLPAQLLVAVMCLYQTIFTITWFLQNPVEFLAEPTRLFLAPVWVTGFLPSLLEGCWYFRWHRRAKRAAENGLFYEMRANHIVSFILLAVSTVMLFLAFGLMPATRFIMAVCFGMVLLVVIAVGFAKKLMQKRGFSRNANRILSVTVSLVLTMVLLAGLTAVIFQGGVIGSKFTGGSAPVGTYDYNGWEMDVYADSMPLYVQDLIDTEWEEWSMQERKSETFLVSKAEYRQWPLTTDKNAPELEYTVVEVKADFLYEYCKNSLVNAREDEVVKGQVLLADHYERIDSTPWGAAEAYRLYWSDGYRNQYLLCYEDRIVEISLDAEPTPEQMAVIAEKLD